MLRFGKPAHALLHYNLRLLLFFERSGTFERRWKPFTPGKRADVTLAMRAISVARDENRTTVVDRDFPEHLLCVRADWQDDVDKFGEQHVRDEILQSFCPEVHGMYLVKLALVLALSSGMNVDCIPSQQSHTVRGNSHVILVGDPGLAKSKLLRFAARIAPRAVHTTGMGCSVAGLTAAAVKVTCFTYLLYGFGKYRVFRYLDGRRKMVNGNLKPAPWY